MRRLFKEILNASRPSEHPPVGGENVKTLRWDHSLQIQNLLLFVLLKFGIFCFVFISEYHFYVRFYVKGCHTGYGSQIENITDG